MKRIFIAGTFILFAVITQAQNVGIGTTAPVAKLNIVGIGSDPAIPGVTSTGVFRIGITANQGIDFGKQITSPFSAWMQAGFGGSTPDPISLQPLGGNVGIGILSPTAKLDVNGTMKIQGTNTLEFGAGVTGKETNAGKIGYQTFTPGALDIVGAGTLVSNRKVNIFAEGGTTFNGPINVGGSTGTAGQVLTSNGVAAPTWENAAYSNNIRFAVSFTKSLASPNDFAVINATRYNLNTTEIVISSTGIAINRSGLYHFDLGVGASMNFATALTSYPALGGWLYIGGTSYDLIHDELMRPQSTSNTQFLANGNESLEVYITAPATIRVYHNLCICGSTLYLVSGYLTGHLISE
jgi:hypothetical protein